MSRLGTRDCGLYVFALTIFVGAFLLFQVQPLLAKFILPWFGGGAGVWTTCILFFQVMLLAGYAYAYASTRWLEPSPQMLVHFLLLTGALMVLPIVPKESWKPTGTENPTVHILLLLASTVGLPYFVLSSTGPLIQQWVSRIYPQSIPYRLYALSNLGSLLALLSYPFYFESHFTRKAQAAMWAWGLAIYAIACGYCVWRYHRERGSAGADLAEPQESRAVRLKELVGARTVSTNPGWVPEFEKVQPGGLPELEMARQKPESRKDSISGSPAFAQRLLWVLLPACSSALLLATTNKMCQDVAAIPFLWVAPLALYLLSFIISFEHERWYVRLPYALALLAALGAMSWALFAGTNASLLRQIEVYSGALFVCCMVCHGELYQLRPSVRHLTEFYLWIAAGGALGGVLVGVVAPLVFTDYFELHWSMLLCLALFILVCARDRTDPQSWQWLVLACILPLGGFVGLDLALGKIATQNPGIPGGYFFALRILIWVFVALVLVSWVIRKKYRGFAYWQGMTCVWLFLGLIALATTLHIQAGKGSNEQVYAGRNFFGVLKVFEHRKKEPLGHHFLLQHGRITHGIQFIDPQLARRATTYYNPDSGVGLAWAALPAGPRKIGLVGLGTGTLTTYARPEDELRIYEIDPQVSHLAASRFHYLSNCAGSWQVVLGDARLSLEKEASQQFDLLALDAFSSDAIPVHLLTREAFALYGRHLTPGGILAVHISNHYLDLEPVVTNLARLYDYKLALVDYEETDDQWWAYSSTWVLLTRDASVLDSTGLRDVVTPARDLKSKVPLWTDEFASLFQVFK